MHKFVRVLDKYGNNELAFFPRQIFNLLFSNTEIVLFVFQLIYKQRIDMNDMLVTYYEKAMLNLVDRGCFPLCQRLRKFRSEFKWKGPFRFLPTGIFGITSGGGPLISVGIFRPKFTVPFLTNRFFALIRELQKGTKSDKSHSYWLARYYRKMSFHFPRVFLLISDRSVWYNGKHPGSDRPRQSV